MDYNFIQKLIDSPIRKYVYENEDEEWCFIREFGALKSKISGKSFPKGELVKTLTEYLFKQTYPKYRIESLCHVLRKLFINNMATRS